MLSSHVRHLTLLNASFGKSMGLPLKFNLCKKVISNIQKYRFYIMLSLHARNGHLTLLNPSFEKRMVLLKHCLCCPFTI